MTACGGGGGGGGNDPTSGSGSTSGSATKGIIRNGLVTLSQPEGQGSATGSGRTLEDGTYSLDYTGYAGGLVQICVTSDAQTTVVCDASDGPDCGPSNGNPGDTNDNGIFDLGEALPAPADFSMCTRLPAPPASGVSAPITPFTNVVVQRAMERAADEALNEDAATALARAANEVSQLVGGLDVLRLTPVDLSNPGAVAEASPEALVYAALIAAVLGNSVDRLGEGEALDLNAVVASILTATEGGRIGLDDFRALLAEAQEQLLAQGQSDDYGILATLNDQADEAERQGATSFDPEPPSDADASRIARARGLIQNVRNTYASLEQYDAPLDAFEVDLKNAATVVEANQATAQQLEAVLNAAVAFFNDDPACDDENCETTIDGITTSFATSSGTLTGTMTGTSDSTGAVVDIEITGPAGHADGQTEATINIARATVSSPTARLRVTKGTATITLSQPFDAAAAEDDDPTNDQSEQIFDQASFDLVGSVEALSNGSVIGSATGTLGFNVVKATDCTLAPTDPDDADSLQTNVSSLTIAGEVAAGSGSADLKITASLANARSFCPLTDVAANNKPEATLTVTANLNLDAVPDARAVFTAKLDDVFDRTPDADDDRTQGIIANAAVNLLQNNAQVFRLVAETTRPASSNNELVTVTVTDSNSTELVLTKTVNEEPVPGEIGVITVDGERVGVIRQLDSGAVIARYDDGTFESLF